MNVGVMKDYKLRDLLTSHTLGWSWYWNEESRTTKGELDTWVCLRKLNS